MVLGARRGRTLTQLLCTEVSRCWWWLLDFQMGREACQAKWAPKASSETLASPRCTLARRALTEGQDSRDPQGLPDRRDQMVSGRKLGFRQRCLARARGLQVSVLHNSMNQHSRHCPGVWQAPWAADRTASDAGSRRPVGVSQRVRLPLAPVRSAVPGHI